MADLCGPSNALRAFRKHATLDRPHQQDRLVPSRSAAEGFRSPPGTDIASLDAEFEAFQSSQPPELEDQALYDPVPTRAFHGAPQSTDWAADFQGLNLTADHLRPIPSSQFHHYAPLQRSSPSPRPQESLAQPKHPHAETANRLNDPYTSRSQQGFLQAASRSIYYPNRSSSVAQSIEVNENEVPDEFLRKAFEQAFDEHGLRSVPKADQNAIQQPEGDSLSSPTTVVADSESIGYRIGSDRILDESQNGKSTHEGEDDADALAKTAGVLLENVKGDTSKKFQQSNFLSLMRRLRDREVEINGDQFVNTTQPLHPGGVNYPPSHEPAYSDHYQGLSS